MFTNKSTGLLTGDFELLYRKDGTGNGQATYWECFNGRHSVEADMEDSDVEYTEVDLRDQYVYMVTMLEQSGTYSGASVSTL